MGLKSRGGGKAAAKGGEDEGIDASDALAAMQTGFQLGKHDSALRTTISRLACPLPCLGNSVNCALIRECGVWRAGNMRSMDAIPASLDDADVAREATAPGAQASVGMGDEV